MFKKIGLIIAIVFISLIYSNVASANDYGGWMSQKGRPTQCFYIDNLDSFNSDIKIYLYDKEQDLFSKVVDAESGKCYPDRSIVIRDYDPDVLYQGRETKNSVAFPNNFVDVSGSSYAIGFFDLGLFYGDFMGMQTIEKAPEIVETIEADFKACDIRSKIEHHINILLDPSGYLDYEKIAEDWILKNNSGTLYAISYDVENQPTPGEIAEKIGCGDVFRSYGETRIEGMIEEILGKDFLEYRRNILNPSRININNSAVEPVEKESTGTDYKINSVGDNTENETKINYWLVLLYPIIGIIILAIIFRKK